jgi:hypothetical protein
MELENQEKSRFSFLNSVSNLFCKANRKAIIDVIVVITPLLLIYVYFVGMGTLPEIKDALKENKKIQTTIDSIQTDNQFIVQRMYELEKNQTMFFDMVNKNNELIKENNKQLSKLKRIYNDKINNANTYDVSQLDSFFTDKYRDYYNR